MQKIAEQQKKLQDAGLRVAPAKPSFMEHVIEEQERKKLIEDHAAAKEQSEKDVKSKIKNLEKIQRVKKVRSLSQRALCTVCEPELKLQNKFPARATNKSFAAQ